MSTAANLGQMDERGAAISTITGNLVLVQCQGIVVGFLASLCGLAMGWLPSGGGHYEHALLLCASAIVTASLASFALALVMIVVIVGARRCRCNPDNIATPIAASLGDVVTLGLLAWISDVLYNDYNDEGYKAHIIQVAVLLYMCQILVYWMWKRGVDPDNAAIPYLTAIGDLLGTSLLAMAFLALEEIGDTSLNNLEHHANSTHHNDSMEGVTEQVVSLLAELTTLTPLP